jgi:hypothetical protein
MTDLAPAMLQAPTQALGPSSKHHFSLGTSKHEVRGGQRLPRSEALAEPVRLYRSLRPELPT